MAVGALHPMDIVRTFWVEIAGIHLLQVEFAFALRRVAGGARGSSIFVVPVVARDATEPLMNSGWGTVVTSSHLRSPMVCRRDGARFCDAWTVTLVAHRLARIRAHLHRARAVLQLRDVERCRSKVAALTAVEEGQGAVDRAARHRNTIRGLLLHCAGTMHPMAAFARNGGLIREVFAHQMPWALCVHWLNKIANRTVEVHTVAAETILH